MMAKLTPLQKETIAFLKMQIDEARKHPKDSKCPPKIIDAQKGIVYTQGGNVTIRTLKKLEEIGLIEILEDNSGIGTGFGAFPSKVRLLNC